ncbi:MAG: hypothetical protein Q7S40_03550 [Opitutaceae bacterium]|nr:hypothetical protein [Opitutaceae bacterium]
MRKITAEAELAEYNAKIAKADLVSMDTARAYIAEILAPLRALLDALPQSVGPRANVNDPAAGEQAVREGLQGVFRAMEKHRDTPPDGGPPSVG